MWETGKDLTVDSLWPSKGVNFPTKTNTRETGLVEWGHHVNTSIHSSLLALFTSHLFLHFFSSAPPPLISPSSSLPFPSLPVTTLESSHLTNKTVTIPKHPNSHPTCIYIKTRQTQNPLLFPSYSFFFFFIDIFFLSNERTLAVSLSNSILKIQYQNNPKSK